MTAKPCQSYLAAGCGTATQAARGRPGNPGWLKIPHRNGPDAPRISLRHGHPVWLARRGRRGRVLEVSRERVCHGKIHVVDIRDEREKSLSRAWEWGSTELVAAETDGPGKGGVRRPENPSQAPYSMLPHTARIRKSGGSPAHHSIPTGVSRHRPRPFYLAVSRWWGTEGGGDVGTLGERANGAVCMQQAT